VQLQTKEVDRVVSGGVQEEAEGVGQKAVTAQAVGAKAVFELLDAIRALSAIVVESEDFGGRSVARRRGRCGQSSKSQRLALSELPHLSAPHLSRCGQYRGLLSTFLKHAHHV
jgi:hypothetical protein